MLITPRQLKARIEAIKAAVPAMVQHDTSDANLVKMNIANLMQGKDSTGANMPPYRNSEYANFKVSINPKNRGFWDLRVTGAYHRSIRVDISSGSVKFHNIASGTKAAWLDKMFVKYNVKPFGLPDKIWKDFQDKQLNRLQRKVVNLINNGFNGL